MSPGAVAPRDGSAPARPWYKMTAAEFYVYVVAFLCGISMLMPINAVFSAPSYMLEYYLYATQNPDLKPEMTNFWSNVLTYYNLISLVTSLVVEPMTLLDSFRRIPMLPRLLGGLGILIIEIILLMVVPAKGTTEGGAVATICMAGMIGGLGKSIFESTVYGMFSAFPSTFTSTMMGGVGVSGVITSLIQISVKGALPDTYEGVKMQSYIYYGLDVGIQATTFVALILLRFNSFAREYFGDLGGVKSKVDAGSLARAESHEDDYPTEPAMGEIQEGHQTESKEDPLEQLEGGARAVDGPTSNELLRSAPILGVLRLVKWMFISLGFDFVITLFLFPTIATGMYPESKWFATISVFIFNLFDVLGRWSPSLSFMWPRTYSGRKYIVAGSFARVLFVPLLILLSYRIIDSQIYGYLIEVVFAFSSGYIASMSLVLGPKSKGIDNDGKRFVAGTLMGIAILVGGTIGTVLSIMTQTLRDQ